MKLLSMTFAEMKLIMRMGLTSLLVLSYPLLIIIMLGPAFSSSIKDVGGVLIAVYDTDPASSGPILSSIENVKGIKLVKVHSEAYLKEEVSTGQVPLGIEIGTGKDGQYVAFFSNTQESLFASNMIISLESELAKEKGAVVTTSISQIFAQVGSASQTLDNAISQSRSFREEIESSKSSLADLKNNTEQMRSKNPEGEISAFQSSIDSAKSMSSDFRASLTDLNSKTSEIDDMTAKIDGAINQLNAVYAGIVDFENKRVMYLAKIDSASAKLTNYDSELSNVEDSLYAIRAASSDAATLAYVNNALSQVSSARADAESSLSDLSEARTDLTSIDTQGYEDEITNTENELYSEKDSLAALKSEIINKTSQWDSNLDAFDSNIADSESSLSQLSNSVEELDAFLGELETFADNSTEKLDSLSARLEGSEADFQLVSQNLNNITRSTDSRYLSPVKFSSENVVPNNQAINVFFPAILGVDLVLASMLLPLVAGASLRNQGMYQRIKDSRLGAFNFIFGRFLGNYLISLLQVFILTLAAFVLFNIGSVKDWPATIAVFLIVPAVFTSLGVLFSMYVKKESTAILLTLLVGIPSIFLSGSLIPVEFFPEPFQSISKLLPLYPVTNAISITVVNGLTFSEVLSDIGYLLLLVFIFLLAAYLSRKAQE